MATMLCSLFHQEVQSMPHLLNWDWLWDLLWPREHGRSSLPYEQASNNLLEDGPCKPETSHPAWGPQGQSVLSFPTARDKEWSPSRPIEPPSGWPNPTTDRLQSQMKGLFLKPLSFEVAYDTAKASWYISLYPFHPCHNPFLTATWIQVSFIPQTLCTCYSQYKRAPLIQISICITLFRSLPNCEPPVRPSLCTPHRNANPPIHSSPMLPCPSAEGFSLFNMKFTIYLPIYF